MCRRWYCEYCGPRLGVALRFKAAARVKQFTSVFGITLTVDGALYASPEQAWLDFSTRGLIGRFVRDLDRRGHLHSKAYFWTVEFQKQTEQPHWHLLLDAGRIPYGEIVEIYSRYRPPHAPPLEEPITAENYKGRPPAFGSVRFSPPGSPNQAAFYATKYLVKYPPEGFPQWVLQREGRVPRFNHSRRFFPVIPGHDPMCFCEVCRGAIEAMAQKRQISKEKNKEHDGKESAPRRKTTIQERLDRCGTTCSLVEVNRVRLPDGSIVDGRSKYVATLDLSFRQACKVVGASPDEAWQLDLDWNEADRLAKYAKGYDVGEAA